MLCLLPRGASDLAATCAEDSKAVLQPFEHAEKWMVSLQGHYGLWNVWKWEGFPDDQRKANIGDWREDGARLFPEVYRQHIQVRKWEIPRTTNSFQFWSDQH